MIRIPYLRLILLSAAGFAFFSGLAQAQPDVPPHWLEPMKKVHARFTGTPGTFAQFGDSITVSMAFWAPLRGEPKNMPK